MTVNLLAGAMLYVAVGLILVGYDKSPNLIASIGIALVCIIVSGWIGRA